MAVAVRTHRGPRGRVLGTTAALAGFAASSALVGSAFGTTSYPAVSPLLAVVDVVAGAGILLAGTLLWWERPGSAMGPLAVLLGAVWFAPDWVGWSAGPPVARSIAALAAPFGPALLAHLVLAAPVGRVPGPVARRWVIAGYLVTAGTTLAVTLLRDPFLDPACWNDCTAGSLAVRSQPALAAALVPLRLVLVAIGGIAVAGTALRRLAGARPTGRRLGRPVLTASGAVALAETARATTLLLDRTEDPSDPVNSAVFLLRAVTLAALAGALVGILARDRRARGAVARLAADLGDTPAPGTLGPVLARALADPTLEVAYWLPESGHYVAADGRELDIAEAEAPGRVATPVVRDGAPVALVLHDDALAGTRDLGAQIGAAARLAVDNERLRAEVLAHVTELRASRSRIVEAGDRARRRLERDLHDGAQQHLVALLDELRLARAAAEQEGDATRTALLTGGAEGALDVLAGVREVAHGLYPAELGHAGLSAALTSLAEVAALPVELVRVPRDRLDQHVERAAYLTVAEAVEHAAAGHADHLEVAVDHDGDSVTVTARPVGRHAFTPLADRVGALGGRVEVRDGVLRVVLPCG